MMGGIGIVLRRSPYGSVEAAEAIRHALGGIGEGFDVNLMLMDGGVEAARKNQDISDTEYLSVEEGIRDCLDMGVAVYAEKISLAMAGLSPDSAVEGVAAVDESEIAGMIKESDTTMIF
ncbi:MAG: DsrE family protein [Candidatus Sulfobium sp.]|jgi:sulfur relay (sulfurtransferase) DsrF/TusC family protein